MDKTFSYAMIAALTCNLLAGSPLKASAKDADNMRQDPVGATGQTQKLSQADVESLKKLAGIDLTEMKLGQYLKDKATNPAVSNFGDTMVKDHSQRLDRLKEIASANGITLPEEIGPVGAQLMAKLDQAKGAGANREFMKETIGEQLRSEGMLRGLQNRVRAAELRNYVRQAMTSTDDQLGQARTLFRSVAANPGPGTMVR